MTRGACENTEGNMTPAAAGERRAERASARPGMYSVVRRGMAVSAWPCRMSVALQAATARPVLYWVRFVPLRLALGRVRM